VENIVSMGFVMTIVIISVLSIEVCTIDSSLSVIAIRSNVKNVRNWSASECGDNRNTEAVLE